MKGAHILIVDDEPNIRLMLRSTLATEGYSIEEAANGREGLNAIDRRLPDLLILDLSMPEMDGISVLTALQAVRPPRRPRVIVLTAYGSIPTAVKATRLGALDFLEKPVSPIEVREAVATALAEVSQVSTVDTSLPDELSGGYEAVLNRVRKSLRMAKYADAESLMMRAADLSHRDAAYFNLLGVLYESQRQWKLAKKFYKKSLAENGHYEPAKKNMLRIYELEQYGRSNDAVTLGDEPDIWFARLP